MAPDSQFMLGEHSARLAALEASVLKIDKNVDFLVERETARATRETQQKVYLATAGGFLGAVVAFVASIVKEWLLR